ncbi:MAG: serine/threonine-protein kinase [Kofleriaceae bacterium]|nr:serine/threonine-protein kinase [Kofleriaceae bacterium]
MMELSPGYRDSSSPALNRGDLIAGVYAIRDQLTRTETGVVFEARDMLLDRLVAVKLAWRDAGNPSMILEARRCAAVSDPCAVAIYGMGHHDGVEYVVGERVSGTLLSDLLARPLPPARYLALLRTVFAAVARAHEAGIAVGDISGATTLIASTGIAGAQSGAEGRRGDEIDNTGRIVLGRFSLSQVPAFGPLGQVLAPEVVRGDVDALNPAAAEAIDLYGLGCIAIEMACGTPPFGGGDHEAELRGHGHAPPPRLGDLRDDLPVDLSDLVEWLLAKSPGARPPSAKEALAQLDAIIEREGKQTRTIRVLVVEDDAARARWMWSLARRAYAAAAVEIASEGTDAAHKLNRDHPDLVFIDAQMRGVMNALELCMYQRGLETENTAQLVIVGAVSERDRSLLNDPLIAFLPEDANLASAILERVRQAAATPTRRRRPRKTISG